MTDDSQSPETGDQTPDVSPMGGGVGDFSSGEGMVALAGLLLLANFLIFELIMAEYFISYALLLLAVAAAVLPRIRREAVESFHPLGQIMKVIGYAILILGVFEILDDIRFDDCSASVITIGALVAYAAYAVAFLGSLSTPQRNRIWTGSTC